MNLPCFLDVCVCVSCDIWAHFCCLRIKIGYTKKKKWKHEQLRNFPIEILEPLSCMEDIETLSNWEFHRNIYFAFSFKYISTIFMRPKTLGEPPVPSHCGLSKLDLTDIQFFVYLLWQRFIECLSKVLNFRPIQYQKWHPYVVIAGVIPWEIIFHVVHQCRDAFTELRLRRYLPVCRPKLTRSLWRERMTNCVFIIACADNDKFPPCFTN